MRDQHKQLRPTGTEREPIRRSLDSEGQGGAPEDMGLVERWQDRQAQLSELLEQWGATECERRVGWSTGLMEWVETSGDIAVSADMKALCSYSFADESLMMAWANQGLEEGAVIEPQPDIPELIESCAEPEAWLWAMRMAEQVGAEYLYRISAPQYLVFLGLWNVRGALPAEPLEPGTPQAFVTELLDELQQAVKEKYDDPTTLRRLFINHGESLNQNAQYLYSNKSDGGLLRRTGDTLIEIGKTLGQRRFGVLPPASLSEQEVQDIQKKVLRLQANWRRGGGK